MAKMTGWRITVDRLKTFSEVLDLLDAENVPTAGVSTKWRACVVRDLPSDVRSKLTALGAQISPGSNLEPEGHIFGVSDLVVDPFDNWGPSQEEIDREEAGRASIRDALGLA